MAKSKRNRVISLTKTKKAKLLDKKAQFIEKVHSLVDTHDYVYTFVYKNLTTLAMQSLRQYFRSESSDSVFLLGKSTVMKVALGRSEEESYAPNIYNLSETIKGTSGLFFSNKAPDAVIK